MDYSLSHHQVKLTSAEEDQIEKKLARLDKHLHPPYVADIRLIRDQHHQHGDVITCRVNIEQRKTVFHAERSADSVLDAIDAVIDVLNRDLTKQHDKNLSKRRR